MPIVTDRGFEPDDRRDWRVPDQLENGDGLSVLAPNTLDAAALAPEFDRIALIAVEFPAYGDGRGFSVAQRLRALGYRGRLRAKGHLIADQWRLARRCGFDEAQIDEALAGRQPEAMWLKGGETMEPPFRARRKAA